MIDDATRLANQQTALSMINAKLAIRGTCIIDAATVMAFCEVESHFDERAYLMDKNGGSFGLMQMDLPTARDRGYLGTSIGLYDMSTNLEYGIRQLVWIAGYLQSHGVNPSLEHIAEGYNEGVGNARAGRPDPDYVAKILAARSTWSAQLQPRS